MSETELKTDDKVLTEVICTRLDELADAVTKGDAGLRREFYMSIPAQPHRDADLILSEAAKRLRAVQSVLPDLEARADQPRPAVPDADEFHLAGHQDVVLDAFDNLIHDNYERSSKGSADREADAGLIRSALKRRRGMSDTAGATPIGYLVHDADIEPGPGDDLVGHDEAQQYESDCVTPVYTQPRPAVPEGYVLVPERPTEEQLKAMIGWREVDPDERTPAETPADMFARAYHAAVRAAQQPEGSDQ